MPIGNYSLVPYIAHDLARHRPKRLLDLGIGFGFYGAVARQWLDFGVAPWSTYLAGVEAWGDYGNPLWDLYDLVVVDTIENYLDRHAESFDWILMTDVIEHFAREEGLHVMSRLRERVSPGGRLLIGTPAHFIEQGAVHGNIRETHRSLWTADEFVQLGFQIPLDGQPDQFGQQMVLATWQKDLW